MTVAIALACADGVILASDSMTTLGSVSMQGQKVFALEHVPLIWAHAGSVATMNEAEIDLGLLDAMGPSGTLPPCYGTGNEGELRAHLRTVMVPMLQRSYSAQVMIPGQQLQAPAAQFLLATWIAGKPLVQEVDPTGLFVNYPRFRAIGSGDAFAQVAHALVDHLLGPDPVPVELGLRIAYRTIDTTCQVASQGIGLPVQVAVVDGDGGRILDQAALDEVRDAVAGWKQIERDVWQGLYLGPTVIDLDEDAPPPAIPEVI